MSTETNTNKKRSYPPLLTINGNIANLTKVNGFVILTLAVNRKNKEINETEFLPMFLDEKKCSLDTWVKDGKEEITSVEFKGSKFEKGSWIHVENAPVSIKKPSEYNNVVKPQITLFEPKELRLNNKEAKIIDQNQLDIKGFVKNISLSKNIDGSSKGLNVSIVYSKEKDKPEDNLIVNAYIKKEQKDDKGKTIEVFNDNDIVMENDRIKSVKTTLQSGTLSLNDLMTLEVKNFSAFGINSYESKKGKQIETTITTFPNVFEDTLKFKSFDKPTKNKEQEEPIQEKEKQVDNEKKIEEQKPQEIAKNQDLDGYSF